MTIGKKHFLVFWDSENDQKNLAQGYADEAEVHAKQIGKPIRTKLVDTKSNDPDKQYWDPPNTIECVTVDGTTKKDSVLDPQDSEIDQMVDDL
jgi:hypothetical protein